MENDNVERPSRPAGGRGVTRGMTDGEAANLYLGRFRHPWTVSVVSVYAFGDDKPRYDSSWSSLECAWERWKTLAKSSVRAVVASEIGGVKYDLPDDAGILQQDVRYEARVAAHAAEAK